MSDQFAFNWETRIELMPTAISSRTKWSRHAFPLEVLQGWDLSQNLQNNHWGKTLLKIEDWVSFCSRLYEPGKLFYRIADEAQFKDIPVMNLDVLDPAEIRSTTHAGVAAWEYQIGWWLSPFQLQTHPLYVSNPLPLRLPWTKEPTLALIAPTYYKHDNYQGVGFPMPNLSIEGKGCRFDLTPENTNAEGTFPQQMLVMEAPGIDWTFRNKWGGWPGFSGFRMAPLPEICTPVFILPKNALWRVTYHQEWIPKPPNEIHLEYRHRTGEVEWSSWTPFTHQVAFEGDHVQIRNWVKPDDSTKGKILRSGAISFDFVPKN
jgi:hypothetical protein